MCVKCRHWEKSGLVSKSNCEQSEEILIRILNACGDSSLRTLSLNAKECTFSCQQRRVGIAASVIWKKCSIFGGLGIMRVENAVQTTLEWPWESGANAQGCLNRANPVPHPLKLEVTNLPARRSGKVTWNERFDYSDARNTGEFLRLFHLGEVVYFGMTFESAI